MLLRHRFLSLTFALFVFTFLGCSSNLTLEPLDLTPHGMPITVLAPAGAEIKRDDNSTEKVLKIKKGKYTLEITATKAYQTAKESKDFSLGLLEGPQKELVLEEESGFVYPKDKDKGIYEFRFSKVIKDSLYNFLPGSFHGYTKDEAIKYYKAAKNEK